MPLGRADAVGAVRPADGCPVRSPTRLAVRPAPVLGQTHPPPVSQDAAPRPAGRSIAATAIHAAVAAAGSSQVSGKGSRRSLLMLFISG